MEDFKEIAKCMATGLPVVLAFFAVIWALLYVPGMYIIGFVLAVAALFVAGWIGDAIRTKMIGRWYSGTGRKG
jgi:hypothetical protein